MDAKLVSPISRVDHDLSNMDVTPSMIASREILLAEVQSVGWLTNLYVKVVLLAIVLCRILSVCFSVQIYWLLSMRQVVYSLCYPHGWLVNFVKVVGHTRSTRKSLWHENGCELEGIHVHVPPGMKSIWSVNGAVRCSGKYLTLLYSILHNMYLLHCTLHTVHALKAVLNVSIYMYTVW